MAGFTLNLTPEVSAQRASLTRFQKKQLPKIVNLALRDTIRALKTEAGKYMSKRVINMPTGVIKKQIKEVFPPPRSYKGALIFLSKKTSSIASFGASKPRKITSGKKRFAAAGLRARVWDKKQLYKGSFRWDRPGTGGTASTAFHRVTGAAKVVPKKRVGGLGKIQVYKRDYTDKQGVLHRKGSKIKRQPIKVTFGTSVAAAFDQKPKGGNRKPVRVTLAQAGRRIFNEKMQKRISNLK